MDTTSTILIHEAARLSEREADSASNCDALYGDDYGHWAAHRTLYALACGVHLDVATVDRRIADVEREEARAVSTSDVFDAQATLAALARLRNVVEFGPIYEPSLAGLPPLPEDLVSLFEAVP